MKILVIVAHPDDELLWGWKDLLHEKNWLVLCITCKNDDNGYISARRLSFLKVTGKFKCKSIVLDYPLSRQRGWVWNLKIQENLLNDIKKYLHKNIKKIVTHNPNGEYGHYHHKIVSKIVTNSVDKDLLYYFNFNVNKKVELPQLFHECFKVYFPDEKSLDGSMNKHKELSKITESIHISKYDNNKMKNIIKDTYSNHFLKERINTFEKFL